MNNLDLTIKTESGYERAKSLDIEHPNDEWILVEFYLPVNGRKSGWVKRKDAQICYCKNTLEHNLRLGQRNHFAIDYLLEHTVIRFQQIHRLMFGDMRI